MKRTPRRRGIAVSTTAMVALIAVATAPDRAQGTDPGRDGTITFTAYRCPAGSDGIDYRACRQRPMAGLGFTIVAAGQNPGVPVSTDAAGTASVALAAADLPGEIAIEVHLPEGADRFEAACQSAPGIAANSVPTDTGIRLLDLQEGASLTCAWFVFATDDASADPKPTPSMTGLPRTGSGSIDRAEAMPTVMSELTALGALILGAGWAGYRWATSRQA